MLRDELEQGTASQLVLWVDANPPWVSRALGALGVLGALGAAKHWEEFAATPANPGFWRHTRPTRVPEWLLTVFPHSSRSAHSDTPEPGQKSWRLQKKKKKSFPTSLPFIWLQTVWLSFSASSQDSSSSSPPILCLHLKSSDISKGLPPLDLAVRQTFFQA